MPIRKNRAPVEAKRNFVQFGTSPFAHLRRALRLILASMLALPLGHFLFGPPRRPQEPPKVLKGTPSRSQGAMTPQGVP